jgi:hypothetical protein
MFSSQRSHQNWGDVLGSLGTLKEAQTAGKGAYFPS